MKRRLAILRIVLAVAAAGLIAAALYYYFESRRAFVKFERWRDEPLLEAKVDFSRRGTFTGHWEQENSLAHGQRIYLTLGPEGTAGRSPAEIMKGLKGSVRVSNSDGNEESFEQIEEKWYVEAEAGEPILLGYFYQPLPKGSYTLAIEISRGARGLAGVQQTLSVRYFLCGLEMLWAGLIRLLAITSGILATLLSVIVIRGFVKYGISRPVKSGCVPRERPPEGDRV